MINVYSDFGGQIEILKNDEQVSILNCNQSGNLVFTQYLPYQMYNVKSQIYNYPTGEGREGPLSGWVTIRCFAEY